MSSLPTPLRRQLENTVKQARKVAAEGARKALEALAVHEPDPYLYMDSGQTELRRKLRAQAAQLGDKEVLGKLGSCEIKHLVEKLAYDQWHRLLFARYLVENNLLISPEHGVSVSLDDCEELAPSLGMKDAWAVAARFAAKELPEIFRADDPAGAVELPAENRKPLIQLVTGLPLEVLIAGDSLGWCYQFWQAERKEEVNREGNKIGADELPAVTQLFTEDYMVDFLLDNTLGAWHAGKWLTANPSFAETAINEDDLRAAVALPGCPWRYLRFIRGEDGKWVPAAGTFAGWPKTAKEVTCLDPCMGSGHFVVAIFERMVALRMAEESLDESGAVATVISDNVFGLEIDPRCTQIAAFNLALTAWRRVGHCTLPAMNLACSGLAPNAKREDWLKLAGDNDRLRNGMDRLYRVFADAVVLGSLISPDKGVGNLLIASSTEVNPLLEYALARESSDQLKGEMAVTARGVAKAAQLLANKYVLVVTNVPYLGRRKQTESLRDFCDRNFPRGSADLATCLVERCLELVRLDGCSAIVTPQNWLFLSSYRKLREHLLDEYEWDAVARLGPGAFETISGEVVNAALLVLARSAPAEGTSYLGIDCADSATPDEKAQGLRIREVSRVLQKSQRKNPDSRIVLGEQSRSALLKTYATASAGMLTGDGNQFLQNFWEPRSVAPDWEFLQSAVAGTVLYGGRSQVVLWENGKGRLAAYAESVRHLNTAVQRWRTGQEVWGKSGVVITCMGSLGCTLYLGDRYDNNVGVVCPIEQTDLPALWAFCSSPQFRVELRRIDQKVNITAATFAKVPFDLPHWQEVAAARYPEGLPSPFSNDPTQWLFNGHPKDSADPLHVAVARLLGYEWPRLAGSSFPDCPALGPDGLKQLADTDGIVCLAATKGESAAAERLRGLMALAYGEDWSASVQQDLLMHVGYAGKTLEDWLRDGFFEQHCALFHHRPFIWHIWDGNKNGFSALVNYHRLDNDTLQSLTYAYLGDWIRRQQAAVDAGEPGSDARLEAAKQLQAKLKLILEGEPPYDLFVRWKPLSKQAIGWHPDLNDGVRMNIRPFATADILRKRVKIKWDKDRGKEPVREMNDFPWFWGWDSKSQDFAGVGKEPDGNRWNDCHLTNKFKREARMAE
jgi:N-6 DNA Methylase